MPSNTLQIYGQQYRQRMEPLLKQYLQATFEQHALDIDETAPAPQELKRLKAVSERLQQQRNIVSTVPDEFNGIGRDWWRYIAQMADIRAQAVARQQCDDFFAAANRELAKTVDNDVRLRQIAESISTCRRNIDRLYDQLSSWTSPWRASRPSTSPQPRPQPQASSVWSPSGLTPFISTPSALQLRCPPTNSPIQVKGKEALTTNPVAKPPRRIEDTLSATEARPDEARQRNLDIANTAAVPPKRRKDPLNEQKLVTTALPTAKPSPAEANDDVQVKEVLSANSAAGPPRPQRDPAGSMKADLRRSSPPLRGHEIQSTRASSAKAHQPNRAGLGFEPHNTREPLRKPAAVGSGQQQQQPAMDARHFPCAFCNHRGHCATHCLTYGTLEKRLLRAARKCICVSCGSLQPEPHLWKACPNEPLSCSFCKGRGHHQAFCRSWLRIFTHRISRRRPQTNNRKNPTRGRSSTSRATEAAPTAARRRTPKAANAAVERRKQLPRTARRQESEYVIPLPWKTSDTPMEDSDVTGLTRATQSLSVVARRTAHNAASEPPTDHPTLTPLTRDGQSTIGVGARNSPQRPVANSATRVAASTGLAANSAACHLGGSGSRAASSSPPSRTATERNKATMCSFAATACDRCGYTGSSTGPLRFGADGKPFNGAVPPDFAAGAVVITRKRPVRAIKPPRIRWTRDACISKPPVHRGGPTRARRPSNDDSDEEFCRPNTPLSEEEQRALDAELDSDNEYGHHATIDYTCEGPYATPSFARPLSPLGGFGPVIGHENETPEDLASTAEEESYWSHETTSSAAFTPHNIASGSARVIEPLFDTGIHAQQTFRDAVYEDRYHEDEVYNDDFTGGDVHEGHSYGADLYEDHVYGDDLDDYDSVY